MPLIHMVIPLFHVVTPFIFFIHQPNKLSYSRAATKEYQIAKLCSHRGRVKRDRIAKIVIGG